MKKQFVGKYVPIKLEALPYVSEVIKEVKEPRNKKMHEKSDLYVVEALLFVFDIVVEQKKYLEHQLGTDAKVAVKNAIVVVDGITNRLFDNLSETNKQKFLAEKAKQTKS